MSFKMIKKGLAKLTALLLAAALLTSCGLSLNFTGHETAGDTTPSTGGSPDTAEITSARDADDYKVEITGSFSLVSADGKGSVSRDGSVWKITSAGVYTAKGLLENGRIEVTAGADDEVEIDLAGASVSSSDAAPVSFLSCGEAKLKAVEGSYNEITDRRPAKAADAAETDSSTVTPETAGGAVYAKCDLKLSGSGSLSVSGGYNNGIHSTKDLKIKNTVLKVTAVNNALKGNNSVGIESGDIILISTGGDGIKTEDSDLSAKGKQRGSVEITGGNITIHAACDGIDAAYDAVISGETNLTVKAGKYSEYGSDGMQSGGTELYLVLPSSLYSGTYTWSAYFYNDDDKAGVWADAKYETMVSSGRTRYYGLLIKAPSGYQNIAFFRFRGTAHSTETYDAATEGGRMNSSMNAFLITSVSSKTLTGEWVSLTKSTQGGKASEYSCKGIKADNEVNISGGTIVISSTDDAIHANGDVALASGKKGTGNVTVSGGNLTLTTGDDGIHGDGTVTVGGGKINILKSHEGIEGNTVSFTAGETYVVADDDGVNACAGGSTPLISVSGGYLDVTTASGDTDGLDSNGNVSVSGGFVFVKGGSSAGMVSGSIDCDGKITVTGGTVVALGGICELPSNSKICTVTMNGKSFGAGSYVLSDESGELVTFSLDKSFYNGWICSDKLSQGGSYELKKDGSVFTSWKQSSLTVQNGTAVSGGMGGPGGGGGGFRPGGRP